MQPLRDLWTPSDCTEANLPPGRAVDQPADLPTLLPSALHHAPLYRSDGWRRLDPNERAAVLLVAEGQKPAAWAPCIQKLAPDILRRLALASFGSVVYRSAAPPDELRGLQGSSRLPDLLDPRCRGDLFGYPRCCVERFISDGRHARDSYLPDEVVAADLPARRFWRQLDETARREGRIPGELIYSAIGFIPCHPFCKPARARLLSWQQVLEAADSPACAALAEALGRGLAQVRRECARQSVSHEPPGPAARGRASFPKRV